MRHATLSRLALALCAALLCASGVIVGPQTDVAAQEKPDGKKKAEAEKKKAEDAKKKPPPKKDVAKDAGKKKKADAGKQAEEPKKKVGKPKKKDEPKPEKKPAKPRPTVNPSDVYFGDGRAFRKPAEVDADLVYAEISAYKEIRDQKLKAGTPRYQLLLSKASRAFTRAVRKAAKKHGYDLVAKPGSVKGAKEIADITQHVIDAL